LLKFPGFLRAIKEDTGARSLTEAHKQLTNALETINGLKCEVEDLERQLSAFQDPLDAAKRAASGYKSKLDLAEEAYAAQKQVVRNARAVQLRVNNGIFVDNDHAKLIVRNSRWTYGNVEIVTQCEIDVVEDMPIWLTETGFPQRCMGACSGFHSPSHCPKLEKAEQTRCRSLEKTRPSAPCGTGGRAGRAPRVGGAGGAPMSLLPRSSERKRKRPSTSSERKRKRPSTSSLLALPPNPCLRG
jgi:hypothetical protein